MKFAVMSSILLLGIVAAIPGHAVQNDGKFEEAALDHADAVEAIRLGLPRGNDLDGSHLPRGYMDRGIDEDRE